MRRLQGGPAALGENDAARHHFSSPRIFKFGAGMLLAFAPLRVAAEEMVELVAQSSERPMLGIGILLMGSTFSALAALRARRVSRSVGGRLRSFQSILKRRDEELDLIRGELAEIRRMNTLGLLSASIAHDLNNYLSAVRMSNKLVARFSPELPEVQKRVQIIENSIQHLRELVEALLGTNCGNGSEPRCVEVAPELEGLVAMVQDGFLAKVSVELSVAPEPLFSSVSRPAFRRILLNLIVNAAEAMNRSGTLRIHASRAELVSFDSLLLYPASADSWILVTVEDTGSGMSSEALDRLFDPTYSTKRRDNRIGTGLGLYIVHTLSVEEGIGLGIRSVPGLGTRFELLFPEREPLPHFPAPGCA